MYLLDTNVLSEIRKARPHGGVLAWYKSVPAVWKFIPSISLYEMQEGVELTRLQNPRKAEEISRWIDEAERQMRVLSLDSSAARLAAQMMNGKSAALTADAMIAAIAATNRMTVVTRNTRDFEHFQVPLLNPFL
jgi:predicted nucleic acid-binding protein